MILIGLILGALGLICLIVKKTVLGLVMGVQLLILGGTTTFLLAGLSAGNPIKGSVFGTFLLMSGIAQVVALYSFGVRVFYRKKGILLKDLRNLKG